MIFFNWLSTSVFNSLFIFKWSLSTFFKLFNYFLKIYFKLLYYTLSPIILALSSSKSLFNVFISFKIYSNFFYCSENFSVLKVNLLYIEDISDFRLSAIKLILSLTSVFISYNLVIETLGFNKICSTVFFKSEIISSWS